MRAYVLNARATVSGHGCVNNTNRRAPLPSGHEHVTCIIFFFIFFSTGHHHDHSRQTYGNTHKILIVLHRKKGRKVNKDRTQFACDWQAALDQALVPMCPGCTVVPRHGYLRVGFLDFSTVSHSPGLSFGVLQGKSIAGYPYKKKKPPIIPYYWYACLVIQLVMR